MRIFKSLSRHVWTCFKAAAGLRFLAGLAALGGQAVAIAQMNTPVAVSDLGQYFGKTPPTDLSMQLWSSILGDFATSPFSSLQPTTLMASLFIVFNAAIFAVGTAWLTYGVLTAMAGTAQDGQALGRRMNPLWYPIRAITGISGMTPILGGFTLSQGLLMWIATLGIGIANMIASTAVDNASLPLFQTSTVSNPATAVNAQKIARAMVVSNLCVVALKAREAEANETNVAIGQDIMGVTMQRSGSNGNVVYAYGNNIGNPVCGSVSVQRSVSPRSDSSLFGFRVASVDYSGIASVAATSNIAALDELNTKAAEIATKWFATRSVSLDSGAAAAEGSYDSPGALSQAITEAARQYVVTSSKGVQAALSSKNAAAVTSQAMQNMKVDGWLGIGGWFSTFSEVNAALADAVGSVSVSSSEPLGIANFSDARDVFEAKLSSDKSFLAQGSASASADAVGATMKEACRNGLFGIGALSGSAVDSAVGTATGNCSLGQVLAQKVIETTSNVGGSTGAGLKDHLVNPIIAIKNLGDYILTLSSTVFFGDLLADVVPVTQAVNVTKIMGGVLDKIPGVDGKAAAGKGAELMTTLGLLFFAAGAYMALYVPLIPFVVWLGGAIAYAASFVEGLFAMPLHSLSHLDTEGEGMGQRTAHGYLFFLNTLARPALMVLSFFLASSLVIGLGTIFTKMYIPAMANAQGNSVTGLISILGYVIIYGLIMSIINNACFELVQVIPDQVIGFVGAGSVSTKLGSDAEGKINNLFMMVARVGPQMKKPASAPRKPPADAR